jgi:hypothetical protein
MNQRTIFTSATVYDGRNPRQSNMTGRGMHRGDGQAWHLLYSAHSLADRDPGLNIGRLTDPGRYFKTIVQEGRFLKDEGGASTSEGRDRAPAA